MGARPAYVVPDEEFSDVMTSTGGFAKQLVRNLGRLEAFGLEDTLTARPTTVTTAAPSRTARGRRFPVSGAAGDVPPAWAVSAVDKLNSLVNAQPDWDSYGAPPANVLAGIGALAVLLETMTDTKPMPVIVPTNSGGIQLEWHRLGRDLEIHVQPDSTIILFFEDTATGKPPFEGPIAAHSPQLAYYVDLVTSPTL